MRDRSDLMKKLYEMQHGQQQLMRQMEVQSGRVSQQTPNPNKPPS